LQVDDLDRTDVRAIDPGIHRRTPAEVETMPRQPPGQDFVDDIGPVGMKPDDARHVGFGKSSKHGLILPIRGALFPVVNVCGGYLQKTAGPRAIPVTNRTNCGKFSVK
jgi:hypothetical protein